MKSLNKLLSFSWYCLTHRDERFWQALRNWSKHDRIVAIDDPVDIGIIYSGGTQSAFTTEKKEQDTYYWE